MSADSPARINSRGSYISGGQSMSPICVTPQPVTDKSFIDSVTGFINEVVPSSYSTSADSKEQVQWARFEYSDVNDATIYGSAENESNIPPPLLLVLGYGNGVQVWSIPASGEATEVLSWRQGNVRVLRILPTPTTDSFKSLEDQFIHKRPLMALCDTISPGPHFCSLGFISLKDGDQVKSIQFKNPILDVLANRSVVVVTFCERIAVFDAHSLEDRLTVTTCYPSPGLSPNPVALGSRWLSYAERTMVPAWRSSGGCEGEGVPSYTATVLHAAKSLGKGLREFGESVANSLTGTSVPYHLSGGSISGDNNSQPGVVTILDIQALIEQENKTANFNSNKGSTTDILLAHFSAHTEPIVAMSFDPTGLLLLTADKRGHDFHLFKIHPHPCGSALAAVHHLYVLHRGDTTSKVQDISFSWDSRWVAISTLRGTTHVFPITPYGGPVGVRTHATPHVVNRLSRFQRSAGISADGRSNSPVSSHETPSAVPYSNPRLPPFPHPTIVYPLAQIRQPVQFGPGNVSLQANVRSTSNRQRLVSASEDAPNLKLCAAFASPRAWLLEPRETRIRNHRHTTDSLFIMACHGSLIQYDLDPKHVTSVPREKVCDETSIELAVEAKARWMLLRQTHYGEIQAPLNPDNPLLGNKLKTNHKPKIENEERWLSQVEIVTHAGPHRRLWMGPQFMFKTYNSSSSVPLSMDIDAVEVSAGLGSRPARSNPVNMPIGGIGARPLVPVLIESTSASSYEQSPRLLDLHRGGRRDSDSSIGAGELQLREDLADAMIETPGVPAREPGQGMGHVIVQMKCQPHVNKVVNPVGTVITLPSNEEVEPTSESQNAHSIIYENCDETLFRPIVEVTRTVVVDESASRNLSMKDIQDSCTTRKLPNTSVIPCTEVHSKETKQIQNDSKPSSEKLVKKPERPQCETPVSTTEMEKESETSAKVEAIKETTKNFAKSNVDSHNKPFNRKTLSLADKKSTKLNKFSKDTSKNKNENESYSPNESKVTSKRSNWERELKSDLEKEDFPSLPSTKCTPKSEIDKMVDHILKNELNETTTKLSPTKIKTKEVTEIKKDLDKAKSSNINEKVEIVQEKVDITAMIRKPLTETIADENLQETEDLTPENSTTVNVYPILEQSAPLSYSAVSKKVEILIGKPKEKPILSDSIPKNDIVDNIVVKETIELKKDVSEALISTKEEETENPKEEKKKPLDKIKSKDNKKTATSLEIDLNDPLILSTTDDSKNILDVEENYVEAENCGLEIGETCLKTEILIPDIIPRQKSKRAKNKKSKVRDDEIEQKPETPLITECNLPAEAIENICKDIVFEEPKAEENDEFLSLDPDSDDIFQHSFHYKSVNDFEITESITKDLVMSLNGESTAINAANLSQNESDDTSKIVNEVDSGDSELLVIPAEGSSSLAGQLKASKKKSKKKRR